MRGLIVVVFIWAFALATVSTLLGCEGCRDYTRTTYTCQPERIELDVRHLSWEWQRLVAGAASRWAEHVGCPVFRVGSRGVDIRTWEQERGRAWADKVRLPQLGALHSDAYAFDLAMHELGHLMGLEHDPRPWCLMHADVGPEVCVE